MSVELNNQIINIFLNYGIAGLILYVFYRLFTNELRDLRNSIEELKKSVDELVITIKSYLERK